MRFLSDKEIWKHSPIVTSLLLEGATVGQMFRMWTERTAAGQSLSSWVSVGVALLIWFNWYRIFTPEQKIARYTVALSLIFNVCVISTVVYFRYFVH